MANNNKLETSFPAVNGGVNWGILTACSPIFAYEGGKKVSDVPIGRKFNFALQGNRFTSLSVKIEGAADPLPQITDEQLQEACASMKLIAAKPIGGKVTLYSIGGEMVMTATATGIELVNISGK